MDDRTPTQFIESLESSAFTSFLTSLNDNNAAYVSITLPVACIDPLAALELIDDGEESFYWSHPKNEISIAAGGNLIELRSTGKGRFHDIAAQTAHLKNVIQAYTAIEHVMAGPLFLGGYSFNDHNIGKLWKKFGAARFVLPEWMLLEIEGYHLLTLSFKKKNLTADVIYQEVISKITRFLNLAGELNSTRREQKESPSALCALQTDADKARWYENIETAKSLIRKGKFEKIVLARSLDLQSESEIRPTLLSHHLRNTYPDCYNFLIRPDRHTSFVGATPERLASFKDGMVQTEGLAGTISRGKSALEDATLGRELLKSNKNLEEHKFVVRSIQDSLSVLSLAEKMYVSRQSISKWETNKNYPSIDIIINLSDIFNITIDELLRSDDELKEKVIQDSKKQLGWQSYILIGLGVLMGIVIVSLIKYQEINLISIGRAIGFSVILFISYLLMRIGTKRVKKFSDF